MTTERERFEAWAARNVGQPDFSGYHTDGGRWFYRHNFIRMCWDAWQAALAHARSAELGCIGNPYHERSEGTKTDAAGPAEISLRADLRSAATVPMPQNKEQAELMAKTGMLWLEQNGYAHSAEPQRPFDDEGKTT